MIKRFYVVFLVASYLVVFLYGCTERKARSQETRAEPSVVDYLTGAQQLKTYKRAKSRIKNIEKSLEERYKEIGKNNVR